MNQTRRLLLLAGSWLAAAPGFAAAKHARHKHAEAAASAAPATAADDEAGGTDSQASPANTLIGPVDTVARWAVVIDYNTNATLLDKDADVAMPPSSMTKLMTAYLVYRALGTGKLTLDQQLPVSETAWRMQGSKMFVQVATRVRVEDLIRGMIIQSGNDACIVLAEGIAGSEQAFVVQMNEMAKTLGLTNSLFMNSTGWPDPNHHMSVRDIAILAGRIIRDFPQYYHYDSEKSFTYNNIHQDNRNPLVQAGTADGLKTGHTDAGGYGLCASAERSGANGNRRRVIVVLNGMGSMHQRATEGERILDWAFANFDDIAILRQGQVIDHAKVWLGTAPEVPLVAARDLTLTLPTGWRDHAKIEVGFNEPLNAPIHAGAMAGQISLSFPGYNMLPQQIDLVTGGDVPRLGLVERAITVLRLRLGHGK